MAILVNSKIMYHLRWEVSRLECHKCQIIYTFALNAVDRKYEKKMNYLAVFFLFFFFIIKCSEYTRFLYYLPNIYIDSQSYNCYYLPTYY